MENVKNTLLKGTVCYEILDVNTNFSSWKKLVHATISVISSLPIFGHLPLLDLPSFFCVGKKTLEHIIKDKPPVFKIENWVRSVKNLYI